jgi:formate-dependent nitrite reductase cytochrome c552 subunit
MVDRNTRRAAAWKAVQEYKSAHGCHRCGFNDHPVALQFHHRNGDKKANVSDLIRSDYGMVTIWKEINKCVILCANCHSIESHFERNGQPAS